MKHDLGWARTENLEEIGAKFQCASTLLFAIMFGIGIAVTVAASPLPRVVPEDAGLDSGHLNRIDDLVAEQIDQKNFPAV